MIKERSRYLEHPSNDMLRSAQILEDINGQKSNWTINSIIAVLGVALFISLIMLNFLSKNFEISFFWQNQVPANKILNENIKSFVSSLGGFGASGLGAAGFEDKGATWYRGQQELFFEGVKVFHAPGMPTNDMIASRASNLIFSTSLFSENNQASVIDMSKYDGSLNTRVILRGSQGVNIANATEIVYYT